MALPLPTRRARALRERPSGAAQGRDAPLRSDREVRRASATAGEIKGSCARPRSMPRQARRSTNALSIRCGNAQLPRPSAIADQLGRASQPTEPTPPFRPLDRDAKRLEKLVAKGIG